MIKSTLKIARYCLLVEVSPFGCFLKNNGKTLQIIHFDRVWNHYKPSILGVFPLFLETSIYSMITKYEKTCFLFFFNLALCRISSISSSREPPFKRRFKICLFACFSQSSCQNSLSLVPLSCGTFDYVVARAHYVAEHIEDM